MEQYYASKKMGAGYPHKTFDDSDEITIGNATFSAINTPGHSPDSITIVAKENGKTALFTGDTLFVGDVGRPDLRENVGHMRAKREELAKEMYNTISQKFTSLPDDALVYPAHGAGSLCGKGMSADATSSTLGNERLGNWAFKKQTEEQFVANLLDSQPFIPHYFGYNVDTNKEGAEILWKAVGNVEFKLAITEAEENILTVDVRNEKNFKENHLPGSINIMVGGENSKFETWLGSIVKPSEKYQIIVDAVKDVPNIINRIAKIGYEKQLHCVATLAQQKMKTSEEMPLEDFRKNPSNYTILDIRNDGEIQEGKIFEDAITIPLHKLRENISEIPTNKPIVVHCAAGYRSAAGSSILESEINQTSVYDLGESIKEYR